MCNAKPGARCSGHVKTDIDNGRQRIQRLLNDPSPNLTQVQTEVTALEHHQWDYDGTRRGRAELIDKLNAAHTTQEDRDHARSRLDTAELMIAARARSVADMPPPHEENWHEPDGKARKEAVAAMESRAHQQVRSELAKRSGDHAAAHRAQEAGRAHDQQVRFHAARWGWAMPAENKPGSIAPYRQCRKCGQFSGNTHSCTNPSTPSWGLAAAGAIPSGWEADQRILDLPDGMADPEDLTAATARRQAALDYTLAHGHTQCSLCGQFRAIEMDNHNCPGNLLMTLDLDHLQDVDTDRIAADDERAAREELADDPGAVEDLLDSLTTGNTPELDPAATREDLEELFPTTATLTADQKLGGEQGYCPRCDEPFDSATAHLEHRCELSGPVIDRIYSDMDKRDRVEAMQEDLHNAVSRLVESGKLSAFLDQMTNNGLNNWSFRNRVLAVLQTRERRSHLTDAELAEFPPEPLVMSSADWKKNYGRHQRAGSKAVWVLAPRKRFITETDPKTGEETKKQIVTGFFDQAKFDVSQTTGKPLPDTTLTTPLTGTVQPGAYSGLKNRVAKAGYTYSEANIPGCNPETQTGTLGYTDPETKRVVVDSRLPAAAKQSVLAHELGHVYAGHVDAAPGEYQQHRGRMETEAEACAYMVNRHFGATAEDADSFSPGYIAGWSQGDTAMVNEALTKATKAYIEITDGDWPDHD